MLYDGQRSNAYQFVTRMLTSCLRLYDTDPMADLTSFLLFYVLKLRSFTWP